jgi:hypothetical protein
MPAPLAPPKVIAMRRTVARMNCTRGGWAACWFSLSSELFSFSSELASAVRLRETCTTSGRALGCQQPFQRHRRKWLPRLLASAGGWVQPLRLAGWSAALPKSSLTSDCTTRGPSAPATANGVQLANNRPDRGEEWPDQLGVWTLQPPQGDVSAAQAAPFTAHHFWLLVNGRAERPPCGGPCSRQSPDN